MEIEVLEPHGFCAGVAAALEKARRLAAALRGGPVRCLHGIVHNEAVVADLERRGFVFHDSLDGIPDGSPVLFSAHGVSPAVRREAERRGMEIHDATCPFVAKVHAAARAFAERGLAVAVVGKADHAEVRGILGEAPGVSFAVGSVAEAEALALPPGRGLGVVFQTTVDAEASRDVAEVLRRRFGAEVSGSVCAATRDRQAAVRAFRGDALLVLGSAGSSNTRRLCETAPCRAFLAAGPREALETDLSGVRHLGVTSGASTPEDILLETVAALRRRYAAA